MDLYETTQQITASCGEPSFQTQEPTATGQRSASLQPGTGMFPLPKWAESSSGGTDLVLTEDGLSNGTCEVGTEAAERCTGDFGAVSAEGDGMSELSNSDLSLPEICISTCSDSVTEDMNYEVQQAYRIFSSFLLDKHKSVTGSFLHPIGHQQAQHGVGGVRGWGHAQLKQSMCLRRMEEKFSNQEYETITEFVADFRLMLENCYRYHGVDHWISKQAQKLEIMLEQKLTLLSRTLREKTTLAVTSKGRFGAEEERGSGGTSTRRRLAPRSLATITVGGHESIMVQTLRLEEQQRAKDEKRQRELEKKEAEETCAKEVEEWEQTLLSQASPHTVDTVWELPAIGHFLCLAQTALNLPEIIFFELERCLLMPRCSPLLSKIMSSLLSPPQRRVTLHRRPALPYRRWESELRQRVLGWYQAVGSAHNQAGRAEQLGLCRQFFGILGEVSPLEEKPFHLLPFYQRVWLLKGLCDHVYETQKDVQDAVLFQPIHECRESILGYDSRENAYIHFPHFCGADLRIYCQSPSTPPVFPLPSLKVRKVEKQPGLEGDKLEGMKGDEVKSETGYHGGSMDTGESEDFGHGKAKPPEDLKEEHLEGEEDSKSYKSTSVKHEDGSDSGSSDSVSCDHSKLDICKNSFSHNGPTEEAGMHLKEETVELSHQSKRFPLKQERGFPGLMRTIEAETQEPCLNVGEHSYTGRSPARPVTHTSPARLVGFQVEGSSHSQGLKRASSLECCNSKTSIIKSERPESCCHTSGLTSRLSSESAPNSSEERANDKIWTKKKKRKKKQGREQLPRVKEQKHEDRMSLSPAEATKSAMRRVTTSFKRKDKKKKHKTGKKVESSKKIKDEPVEPSFKLVCTSLEELRELISKTEDELDDLESTKKRLGRWYYRREAVKDLHSTLIRLLNELSPWEPKLVKAFQRNRLRLKKEFDDFKRHPEYNNFVREECISSSSSDDDDDDDEERSLGMEVCSLSDHYRRSEEEELEHVVPRGLWSGASTREMMAEPEGVLTYVPPDHLNHSLTSAEKALTLLPRPQSGSSNITSSDCGPHSRLEPLQSNQSRDSNSAWASRPIAQASTAPKPLILHPTTGLPKGYTPIPTLLAKSVGNKVTLMKRPVDYPGVNNIDKQSKGSSVTMSTSAVITTKHSKAQISPSSSQQNTQGLHQTEVQKQPVVATVMAALPKSLQVKSCQTLTQNSAQLVCKVPNSLGHLVRTENSSSVKISVNPVMDHNNGEKIMQQVVILPSSFLINKNEEKPPSLQQEQQSKGIQVPASKVISPICMSTNVPGFTIPVQQVAPLKNARTLRIPSPSLYPHLQQEAMDTAGLKGSQVCSSQTSIIQGVMSYSSPITNPCPAVLPEPIKSTDSKQELKTVCIRDSHSILVTTRGGNTGIVKVQKSSDQNALGSLPTSPVITISPQFKAFLISKALQTSPSAPSTTPSTIPAVTSISMAQTQKQVSSVIKSPSTFTPPTAAGSIPVSSPGNQAASTTVILSQGSNNSVGSVVATKISHHTQTAAAGTHFQASLVKNAGVPSLSTSGVAQALTQPEFISKTGVKRASTDERSQHTKFILVTPSSSSPSNVVSSKSTPSSTKSLPCPGAMYVSHPTTTLSTTSVGSIPKQAIATGASGGLLTTSLSSHTVEMAFNRGKAVGSLNAETLSKVKSINVPSGAQIQFSGGITTIGQTIGALSRSPSKSTPLSVSDTGPPTATTTELVPATSSHTVTSCSNQLASQTSLPTSSQQRAIPSLTMISQLGTSTTSASTTNTVTMGNDIKQHLGISPNRLSHMCPAQVTSTRQICPAQTSIPSLARQPLNIQNSTGEESTFSLSPSQLALNKTQTSIPSTETGNTQFTTSGTGTIQQRIVINTSTPLPAGTQILLNNARFVVPPQGLGPGSHVLIIPTPASQQVPTASATITGASVPLQGASHVSVASRAPVLPQSQIRLPSVPTVSCPFVPCTPAVGSSPLPTNSNVRLTGTPSMGSTVLPSKTNVVSALPRLLAAPSPVGTSTLVSSPPRLGIVPALVSPVATSAPSVGSESAIVTLSPRAESSSTILPAVANSLSRLPAPLGPLSVVPSPFVPTTLSTNAASVVVRTPQLHSYLPAQQGVSVTSPGSVIPSQQATVGIAAFSTALSQGSVHTGLDTSIKKMVPTVMQPVLGGTSTQVFPTVAVPPIVGALSRMQTLPIATVTPVGNIGNAFETTPVVTAPSSNSPALITGAQSITSHKTNDNVPSAVVLTDQALGKHSLQTSSLSMHTNVASKLLISPDGAVLNTVQCQVNPVELTACPKQADAVVVSHNSNAGVLHTHNSTLPPSRGDRQCTN